MPLYKPDELVYRTIINVLVNARRMNVAEGIFEESIKSGIVPSHDDYVILMSGYTKCGNLLRGLGILQKMKDAGSRPLVSAYNVLLDGCSRSIRGYSLYLSPSAILMLVYVYVQACVVPTMIFSYREALEFDPINIVLYLPTRHSVNNLKDFLLCPH